MERTTLFGLLCVCWFRDVCACAHVANVEYCERVVWRERVNATGRVVRERDSQVSELAVRRPRGARHHTQHQHTKTVPDDRADGNLCACVECVFVYAQDLSIHSLRRLRHSTLHGTLTETFQDTECGQKARDSVCGGPTREEEEELSQRLSLRVAEEGGSVWVLSDDRSAEYPSNDRICLAD